MTEGKPMTLQDRLRHGNSDAFTLELIAKLDEQEALIAEPEVAVMLRAVDCFGAADLAALGVLLTKVMDYHAKSQGESQ